MLCCNLLKLKFTFICFKFSDPKFFYFFATKKAKVFEKKERERKRNANLKQIPTMTLGLIAFMNFVVSCQSYALS